ncbi:hypothetical protein BC833DRAFT_570576 [Globomyces pollinis-pini]|nr:hypothetical protein BC833DRAFT_570576 [Globomyces pollinis-pini]
MNALAAIELWGVSGGGGVSDQKEDAKLKRQALRQVHEAVKRSETNCSLVLGIFFRLANIGCANKIKLNKSASFLIIALVNLERRKQPYVISMVVMESLVYYKSETVKTSIKSVVIKIRKGMCLLQLAFIVRVENESLNQKIKSVCFLAVCRISNQIESKTWRLLFRTTFMVNNQAVNKYSILDTFQFDQSGVVIMLKMLQSTLKLGKYKHWLYHICIYISIVLIGYHYASLDSLLIRCAKKWHPPKYCDNLILSKN